MGPKYIVSFSDFCNNCRAVSYAFDKAWDYNTEYGYSVKTNRDAELIKYASNILGWHIETVSPDEYAYCRSLGIQLNNIILNGPCKIDLIKSNTELAAYINLDNLDEVIAFCEHPKKNCDVGLRINFDLEAKCPGETTAGEEVSRFGFDAEGRELLLAIDNLRRSGYEKIGLHLHTSTKTRSLSVFRTLAEETVELKERLGIDLSFIDIGGGFFGGQKMLGKPTMDEYAEVICNTLKKAFNPRFTKLILEPGASVLATCVYYKITVINVRRIRNINVVTTNGSLLHINPFMVKRNQPFEIETDISERPLVDKQIVCGATCMENDRFATLVNHKELKKGDVLIFSAAGAYTMGFNSHFILNPPEVVYIGE